MAYADPEVRKRKSREYMKRRKAELEAKGICYSCQKRPYTVGPRGGKICDECRNKFRYDRAPEEVVAQKRAYDRHLVAQTKAVVINHYGGKCRRCGIDDHDVLDLHHINGRGKGNRKKWNGSRSYFKKLIDMGFPDDLEVLCANCHRKVHREELDARIGDIPPYKVGPKPRRTDS